MHAKFAAVRWCVHSICYNTLRTIAYKAIICGLFPLGCNSMRNINITMSHFHCWITISFKCKSEACIVWFDRMWIVCLLAKTTFEFMCNKQTFIINESKLSFTNYEHEHRIWMIGRWCNQIQIGEDHMKYKICLNCFEVRGRFCWKPISIEIENHKLLKLNCSPSIARAQKTSTLVSSYLFSCHFIRSLCL